jgi:long-chain acyl-CoA synthetase
LILKSNEKTALVWQEDVISYTELLRHINYFSSLFDAEKTEKVAVFSENCPQWVYAYYAAWKNECIPVPIDFMAPADEVAYMMNDCRPEVLFCSSSTWPVVEELKSLLEYSVQIHVIDQQEYDFQEYEPVEIPVPEPDRTAVIIYTSGTTGSPKGVMLSVDNLLANMEAVSQDIPIFTPDRNVMVLLPLHHVFPLMGTLVMPLHAGATIAFAPSMTSEAIMATLQANKIAIIIGVPRLYSAIRKGIMDKINQKFAARILFKIAETLRSRTVSKTLFKTVHKKFGGNVDYLVSGGAKLDEGTARDFRTLGFEMLEGFGMTEAAPMITFTRPGHWKIGSAGQSMPALDIRIEDGEVLAKGRNIMKGYYQRPEETAAVLKDGWLHTGDLGHIDKEGYLHITGRKKEILVLSNGKNVNPEEIEIKLTALSDCISEVGVYLKDDMLHAAIFPDIQKLKEKGILNLQEFFRSDLLDLYNRKAAPYKRIAKFILLKEELPRTRLGKIQRFKLNTLIEEGSDKSKKDRSEPQFEEYIVIRDFLKTTTNGDIHPDDHIEMDLGLDSLDKVSLQAFLSSTFGLKIQEDIFLHHPTVEKLSIFMQEKKQKLTVEVVKWAEIFREKVDLKLPKSWFTHNMLKNASKVFLNMYFRLKGEGTENIPDGPFILAPNHQSYIDGLFVSVYLKKQVLKNTYFYAKEKHVRNRWLRSLANRNNVIIMDINHDLKQSLQKLAEVLKKGKNIIIFPEGTRTRTGEVGSFKKTFAILSSELNVPIVPVSIKGAYEAMPKGKKIPRPWKKIQVKFHKPIFPEGLSYDVLSEMVYSKLAADQT